MIHNSIILISFSRSAKIISFSYLTHSKANTQVGECDKETASSGDFMEAIFLSGNILPVTSIRFLTESSRKSANENTTSIFQRFLAFSFRIRWLFLPLPAGAWNILSRLGYKKQRFAHRRSNRVKMKVEHFCHISMSMVTHGMTNKHLLK